MQSAPTVMDPLSPPSAGEPPALRMDAEHVVGAPRERHRQAVAVSPGCGGFFSLSEIASDARNLWIAQQAEKRSRSPLQDQLQLQLSDASAGL